MPSGILVGTPMYGGQCFDAYLLGVFDLQQECSRRGITLGLHTVRNESLIPRGRNRVLHDFMASEASHLIFVDADIGFTGRDALRLVAHSQANPLALVGATYAKKNRRAYDPAFVPLPQGVVVSDCELIEIMCLAGGFMCISRDVALRMAGAYRDLWYRDGSTGDEHVLDLFGCYTDPETRQFWSEDYAFCLRWRQIGGRVLLDPNIQLTHNGTTTFDGDPRSVFVNPTEPVDPDSHMIRDGESYAEYDERMDGAISAAGGCDAEDKRERAFPDLPISEDERVALRRAASGAAFSVFAGPTNFDRSLPWRRKPEAMP